MDKPGSAIRRSAVIMMGIMVAVWIGLYFLSFAPERGQASPHDYTFHDRGAVEGRKVFQAYNCMGCHTIVGNGAYFAPDLTDIHETAGPAWLAAYLPSAGTWPTEGALALRIRQLAETDVLESDSLEDYYRQYPGARKRVEERGGLDAKMPNLGFREGEVDALIAFMAYTSAMDNEGWPPRVKASESVVNRTATRLRERAGVPTSTPASGSAPAGADNGPRDPGQAAAGSDDRVARGERLAADYGCTACHSDGRQRLVGPGWGGLYGSERQLDDGSTATVDDSYLRAAVLEPDRHVPEGFSSGMMPSFEGQLSDEEIDALVAYMRSLADEEGSR